MKILMSGARGLVGSALGPLLESKGHSIVHLHRGASGEGVAWDPLAGRLDAAALEGMNAVVHLAGESIAGGRWSEKRKRGIRDSRVLGTRLLAEALGRMKMPPRTLICASAVGYYGDRGAEELTEMSPPGRGFLSETCVEWEAAAEPARAAGIRVVHVRFGLILAQGGGLLAALRPIFLACAGGRLGRGDQFMSWIAISDVARSLAAALEDEAFAGAMNVSAPNPVSNADFTRLLAAALHRPVGPPVPAFAARLLFGQEMADSLLFASTRVRPGALLDRKFAFQLPELECALQSILASH